MVIYSVYGGVTIDKPINNLIIGVLGVTVTFAASEIHLYYLLFITHVRSCLFSLNREFYCLFLHIITGLLCLRNNCNPTNSKMIQAIINKVSSLSCSFC